VTGSLPLAEMHTVAPPYDWLPSLLPILELTHRIVLRARAPGAAAVLVVLAVFGIAWVARRS
jgi:hypothetical protein